MTIDRIITAASNIRTVLEAFKGTAQEHAQLAQDLSVLITLATKSVEAELKQKKGESNENNETKNA